MKATVRGRKTPHIQYDSYVELGRMVFRGGRPRASLPSLTGNASKIGRWRVDKRKNRRNAERRRKSGKPVSEQEEEKNLVNEGAAGGRSRWGA